MTLNVVEAAWHDICYMIYAIYTQTRVLSYTLTEKHTQVWTLLCLSLFLDCTSVNGASLL
jgi:hypothetical protein